MTSARHSTGYGIGGLIHKLQDMGCSNALTKWFASYLSNRRQRVVLNGQVSEWTFVKAGVPQGSILGPLLFFIYINDIVNELRASVRLFADDTSLYIVVENPNTAALTLNNDLNFMQCSSLNADLYRKNIVPSPSCTCGEFESAYHFFFKSTNYSLARRRYLPNNINEFNTNDLLCGLSNVPDHENATLFSKVQDFILHSKRFA